MKKKIFILFLMHFLFFSIEVNSQINPHLENVTVNGAAINNCSTINFGINSSVSLTFKMRITKASTDLVDGTATFKLYVLKNGTSTPQFIDGLIVNNSAFTNGTSWEGNFAATLQASNIDATGSIFYGIYEATSTIKPQTCNYPLTKTSPTFTLSPTTLNVSCGDTGVKTFTVTPANIPPGATISYDWVIGSNWSGTATTTMSSISLTASASSIGLGDVSVTPILNGVAQPTLTCDNSRAVFNPTTSITGNATICPSSSSNYSLTNNNNYSISWTLNNSTVATLSSSVGSTVTVNATAEGSTVLTATIINACNQPATRTFNINIGAAKLNNNKIQGGYDNVPVGSNSVLTVSPATGATSYQWSIVPAYSSCISSSGSVTGTLPYLVNNGTYSRVVYWGSCTGQYRVRCYASNSCGNKYYSDKVVKVFNSSNNPCPSGARIGQNSIKDDNGSVNIIDEPDLLPCNNSEIELKQIGNLSDNGIKENFDFTMYPNPSNGNFNIDLGAEKVNYNIEIFSSIGRKVYEKSNSNQKLISLSNFKPGIYMVKVSVNGNALVKNIVIK